MQPCRSDSQELALTGHSISASLHTAAGDMLDVKLFTTGGTIDKIYFDAKGAYAVGDPQAAEILTEANLGIRYGVESVLRKDSLDLTEDDRVLLRDRVAADPVAHVVVTHGTDTMVQTARVLAALEDKTIVLTGAMQPARMRYSDAAFNVGFAMAAAILLPAGVHIAMNGRILDPFRARKNLDAGRFESTLPPEPGS